MNMLILFIHWGIAVYVPLLRGSGSWGYGPRSAIIDVYSSVKLLQLEQRKLSTGLSWFLKPIYQNQLALARDFSIRCRIYCSLKLNQHMDKRLKVQHHFSMTGLKLNCKTFVQGRYGDSLRISIGRKNIDAESREK